MALHHVNKIALAAALLATLALAGCGRRGKLEEPPDPAKVEAAKAKAESGDAVAQQRPTRRKARAIQRPKTTTPFDFLL